MRPAVQQYLSVLGDLARLDRHRDRHGWTNDHMNEGTLARSVASTAPGPRSRSTKYLCADACGAWHHKTRLSDRLQHEASEGAAGLPAKAKTQPRAKVTSRPEVHKDGLTLALGYNPSVHHAAVRWAHHATVLPPSQCRAGQDNLQVEGPGRCAKLKYAVRRRLHAGNRPCPSVRRTKQHFGGARRVGGSRCPPCPPRHTTRKAQRGCSKGRPDRCGDYPFVGTPPVL